ncbi:hypothetical protein TRV_01212 [Trichophyton verrucosum HKI 0517]|uniref:Uncharacterized protein n=1 Tax=Trichophyton verrucosum (strain HKI 0517) TaxID=663202 RepID=D4D2A9_TRIVH|nr:uncharacterized protein TRV_01212 [Trichophyton verrucosum HKI 0517]EFE44032.1 hypothetical protein TRV_01212 [Trichophyton verrucosum HKI 0517]
MVMIKVYKPSYMNLSCALFPFILFVQMTALRHTGQQRKTKTKTKTNTLSHLIIPFFIKLIDQAVLLIDIPLALSVIAASSISTSSTNGSYQPIPSTSNTAARRPVSELGISRPRLAEAKTVRHRRPNDYKHILVP